MGFRDGSKEVVDADGDTTELLPEKATRAPSIVAVSMMARKSGRGALVNYSCEELGMVSKAYAVPRILLEYISLPIQGCEKEGTPEALNKV